MIPSELQTVASAVLRLAEQQTYVVPRDIRAELLQANFPESRWKEVVEMLRESLNYRQGRYYFLASRQVRHTQQEAEQELLKDALEELLEKHKTRLPDLERRMEERIDFSYPLKARTENDEELTILSRDLSMSGIGFLSTRSFLGRKLRLSLPSGGSEAIIVSVRVLWSSTVADGIFENGGAFLDFVPDESSS
ncbi:MAG: PilZ domain-containing protein [Gemmataceae bacterium]